MLFSNPKPLVRPCGRLIHAATHGQVHVMRNCGVHGATFDRVGVRVRSMSVGMFVDEPCLRACSLGEMCRIHLYADGGGVVFDSGQVT